MSLASQVSALATRIGQEIKAIRALATAKYTKPSAGIPAGDLSSEVITALQAGLASLQSVPVATTTSYGGFKVPPAMGWQMPDNPYNSYAAVTYMPTVADEDPQYLGVPFVFNLMAAFVFWTGGGWIGAPEDVPDSLPYIYRPALSDELQASLDKADTSLQVQKWSSEILVCSDITPRVSGWGEAVGGIQADDNVLLEKIIYRLPDFSQTVGGTGNLMLSLYVGTPTSGGTLVTSFNLAAGSTHGSYVFTTPLAVSADSVLRINMSIGSTTGNGLQVQFRGKYA